MSAEIEATEVGPVRRRAGLFGRPWLVAALACIGTYSLLQMFGYGQLRGEFLGISFSLGALGGLMLVAFRAFRGPPWLHWLGSFSLNWLFAAYAMSFLAV